MATELLFGGASEGGKSYFGRVALILWCGAIPNLQCFIFRKHYADAIGNHMAGPTSFREMLRELERDKLVKFTENEVSFYNGATISMHGLLLDKDLEKHMGREKHVLWFEESTQILERHIKGLRAWVRMPREMKVLLDEQLKGLYPKMSPAERCGLFPRILHTTNPIGTSVGYFRRGFVTGKVPGEYHWAPESDGGFLRQYIPSLITDNLSADPVAQRKRLSGLGDIVATALITGSWEAPGGDYFPEYNDQLHAIPDFVPPAHWFKYRTFDWGGSDPFAVYWFAVSDGEPFFDHNGSERWYPRGALIVYREWYGCNPEEPAKGLNMRNEDIARGIVERTPEKTCGVTFSDGFPFSDRGGSKNGQVYTMADTFAEHGAPLTRGNLARVYGWTELRARLQGVDQIPMIYIMRSCQYARSYIPALPRHPTNSEDAAEHGESTHSCDALRLGCAVKPMIVDDVKAKEPDFSQISTPATILQQLANKKKGHQLGRR